MIPAGFFVFYVSAAGGIPPGPGVGLFCAIADITKHDASNANVGFNFIQSILFYSDRDDRQL